MQVYQLIEQLEFMDPNSEVHFAYSYGDHWRTTVAPVVGSVERGIVEFSEYHRMDKLLDENEMYEEEGDFENTRRVVVLG